MTGQLAFAGECKARLEPMLDSNMSEGAKSVFEVCKAQAAAGDPEALYYVSFFYFGFGGLEDNSLEGVAATRASAEKGYAQAQYWMGWQHESGGHLPRDDSAALDWYERSAAAGFWMAFDRLARAYRNGELGVPVDLEKADYFLLQKQRCK
jgi:TPR repeat protein